MLLPTLSLLLLTFGKPHTLFSQTADDSQGLAVVSSSEGAGMTGSSGVTTAALLDTSATDSQCRTGCALALWLGYCHGYRFGVDIQTQKIVTSLS